MPGSLSVQGPEYAWVHIHETLRWTTRQARASEGEGDGKPPDPSSQQSDSGCRAFEVLEELLAVDSPHASIAPPELSWRSTVHSLDLEETYERRNGLRCVHQDMADALPWWHTAELDLLPSAHQSLRELGTDRHQGYC